MNNLLINEENETNETNETNEANITITNNKISWLEKYRPQTLADYYISKQQLDVVKTWLKDFRKNNEFAKPFLVLYGTSGIGKTTLAHLIFNHFNYEIIECNASDSRTKKHIRDSIGQISKVSVCMDDDDKFKDTAIIMDEIDGLNGGESSSVQELIDIVTKDKDTNKTKYICPVICTTNSIKKKHLQPLIKQCVMLNIKKPSNINCSKLINKICTSESFTISDNKQNEIILNACGDYRQIIMQLFSYYNDLNVFKNNNELILNPEVNIIANVNVNISANLETNPEALLEITEYNTIKQILNKCETPLEKINYFLTNNINIDIIQQICSSDSNLFYMIFYINVIPIISKIQIKYGLNTKASLLSYYNLLYKIYSLLKTADLLNNAIFLDKKWDLLDYFDNIGIAIPLKLLHDKNKKTQHSTYYIIKEFELVHHTQYNFMRQEQSIIKKKLIIDYMKTHDNNLINIYYNIKRFKHLYNDQINISNLNKKRQKNKTNQRQNQNNDDNKFKINRIYQTIVDKIDELLS